MQFTLHGTSGDPDPTVPPVTLQGIAGPPLGKLSLPISLPFSVAFGSSTIQQASLRNIGGTAFTLSFNTDLHSDFVGAAASDYSFDSSNECTPGFVVQASQSCLLVIKFTPGASGSRLATLNIPNSLALSAA